MIKKNDYLQPINRVKNKTEMLFDKPANGNTVNYILKCDSMVRASIHKHHDKVKLEWGVFTVRDRYHVRVCFHCQRHGHIEDRCDAKANGEPSNCYKCAEAHSGKDCTVTTLKCINCVRYKKSNINHSVNNYRCPIYESELQRIKDNADHGY